MHADPPTAGGTPLERVRRVVGFACLAPSIHNTQPWRWRLAADRVELRADQGRRLPVADPDGRSLVLSCGAALHHAQVAAAGLGLATRVDRCPDPSDQDLLAVVHLTPGQRTPGAVDRLASLEQRCTDRRRFTAWPMPADRLERLAAVATGWGAQAVPLTDLGARLRTEMLVGRARTRQHADGRYAAEERAWIDRGPEDGIPSGALPGLGKHPRDPRARFGSPPVPGQELVESSDGLIAVCTDADGPEAWLRAGETLSELWLQATHEGLSVVPLSQVVEVEETRLELRREIFRDVLAPQVLARIGWQPIGRSTLPRTPRRRLDSVLD